MAIQMTHEEYMQKYGTAPTTGPIKMTREEYQQKYGGADKPTEGIWDAFKVGLKNIKKNIVSSGEELDRTIASPVNNPVLKSVKAGTGIATGIAKSLIAEPVATVARMGGEAIQSATGYDINEATSKGLGKLIQMGMDTDTAKKVSSAYGTFKQENPEAGLAASSLEDIAELLGYLVGYKGAKGAVGKVESGLESTVSKVKSAIPEIPSGTGAKVGGAVEKTGEYAAAQTFGLKPETVRNIIKNPELFTPKEMAAFDRESLFGSVKKAVEKRLGDLSETGKAYEGVKKMTEKVKVGEKEITDLLKSRGIDIKDGKIKVNLGSDIQLSAPDIKGLEEVIGLIKGKIDLSAKEVLNLRTRLSNLAGFAEGKTGASKVIAKQIRSLVDKIAKKDIPGLADLDAKFSSEKQLLEKVKEAIFDKKGDIKPNAISTISNLTGKGKEQLLAKMEKIVPGIREKVNILKSLEDIEIAGGQKVGTYTRTLLGVGGGAVAGGPLGAIIGAIITSPKVGVSILRAYGKMKQIKVDGIINKMKEGKKLIGNEIKIMNEAVDNAAKKVQERAKKIRPGMSIKDITKPILSNEELLDEAKRVLPKVSEISEKTKQIDLDSFISVNEVIKKLEAKKKITKEEFSAARETIALADAAGANKASKIESAKKFYDELIKKARKTTFFDDFSKLYPKVDKETLKKAFIRAKKMNRKGE